MKTIINYIKEHLVKSNVTNNNEPTNDSKYAPEIVTKHLGLKYSEGSGNDIDGPYNIAGSKIYIERGKVDDLDNVFVVVEFYKRLNDNNGCIIVCTTSRANSKTMKIAAYYGLDQKELERDYKNLNNNPNSKYYDTSKFGEVICVHCKDIEDIVYNIRNDWGKGSNTYKRMGWKLDAKSKGKNHWENGVEGEKINNVIQSKEV